MQGETRKIKNNIRAVVTQIFSLRNIGIIAVLLLLYWLITGTVLTVTHVRVSDIRQKRFLTEDTLVHCAEFIKNQRILSLDTHGAEAKIRQCMPLASAVVLTKVLPNTINIVATEMNPDLMFEADNKCFLFQAPSTLVGFSPEVCSNYSIPVVKNSNDPEDRFLWNNLTNILLLSKGAGLDVPTDFELTTEGKVLFVRAHYMTYTTIFLATMPAESYITLYNGAYKGLQEKQEPFSEIDLRFDRVIVR